MRQRTPFLLLAAALALSACGGQPQPRYFPLNPGYEWEYRVHEQNRVTDTVRSLHLHNRSLRERDGVSYARRLASDGNEYWLSVEDGRLRRHWTRTAIDFEPRADKTPRMVMPVPPQQGQWWEIDTRPYILERIAPFRERFFLDDSKRINLRMEIAALDDVVEVPAGRYTEVMRVEGSGLLHVLADARIGASEVPVTHTEWYAPGVGLIKLERRETLDTIHIQGGNITMELVAFER